MLTQSQLKSEIRAWSSETLETKQNNGHATCPYAKNTWSKDQVQVCLSKQEDWSDLILKTKNFSQDKKVLIYCDFNVELSEDEFNSRLNMLNTFFNEQDYWFMGFHQDHDAKSIVEETSFEPIYEEVYNMVFMQRLEELNKASQNLADIGYYSNWTKEEYDNILNRWSIQHEEK